MQTTPTLNNLNWHNILPSFKPEELLSPSLLDKGLYSALDLPSAIFLQEFRDYLSHGYSCGLLVNHGASRHRGVRSLQDQAAINAAYPKSAETFSFHCAGKAWDITPVPLNSKKLIITMSELATIAVAFGWGGVGTYNTFVHVDTRNLVNGKPTLWDYR